MERHRHAMLDQQIYQQTGVGSPASASSDLASDRNWDQYMP